MLAKRDTWTRHKNPDGSLGGWVPSSARVGAGAHIAPSALVNPGSQIKAGERLDDGVMATRDGGRIPMGGAK